MKVLTSGDKYRLLAISGHPWSSPRTLDYYDCWVTSTEYYSGADANFLLALRFDWFVENIPKYIVSV